MCKPVYRILQGNCKESMDSVVNSADAFINALTEITVKLNNL